MQSIERFREQIDTIDDEILVLLLRRLSLAREIGEYKARRGLPIMDLRREAEILGKVRYPNDLCLTVATTSIFHEILRQSRRAQERAIEGLRKPAFVR